MLFFFIYFVFIAFTIFIFFVDEKFTITLFLDAIIFMTTVRTFNRYHIFPNFLNKMIEI
jgi:hypothetical protein